MAVFCRWHVGPEYPWRSLGLVGSRLVCLGFEFGLSYVKDGVWLGFDVDSGLSLIMSLQLHLVAGCAYPSKAGRYTALLV